ncbi:MAG TPA: hypothetical protein DC049_08045 [Spirochaetia bacterium]|nr:hypothetical protein [Spirochaetia bacterium]
MISIVIQQEDKRLVRIQAISDDGVQYTLRKEMCVAGRVVGTKDLEVMTREKKETDIQFASRMLLKATEK